MKHRKKLRAAFAIFVGLGLGGLLTFSNSAHAENYFVFEKRLRPSVVRFDFETFFYKMKIAFSDNLEGLRLGNINSTQGWLSTHGNCSVREFFGHGRHCKKGYVNFFNDTQENKAALRSVIIDGSLTQAKKSLEIFNRARASQRIKALISEVEAVYGQKTSVQVSYRTDLKQTKNELVIEFFAAEKIYTLLSRDISALDAELAEEIIYLSLSRQKPTILNEIKFQQDVTRLVAETQAVENPILSRVAVADTTPKSK